MDWAPVIAAILPGLPLIVAALIAAIPPSIMAWRVGKKVDGRMEEMLELARSSAAAQATLEEKEAEHIRKADAALSVSHAPPVAKLVSFETQEK